MSLELAFDTSHIAAAEQLVGFVFSLAGWLVAIACVLFPLLGWCGFYLEQRQKQAKRQVGRQVEFEIRRAFAVRLERMELALEIMLLDDLSSQRIALKGLQTYVGEAKLNNAARLTKLLDEDCNSLQDVAILERDSVMAHVKTIAPQLTSPSL